LYETFRYILATSNWKNLAELSVNLRRVIISCFLVASLFQGAAQVVVNPNSANACACDGSVAFANPPAAASYNLYDSSDVLLTNGNSAGGNFTINGLCPDVYTLEVIQNAATSFYYINVPAASLNPGNSGNTSICSTDGSVNLNNLIAGIAPGGSWQSPDGNAISAMPVNAEFMTDGWYTYSILSGGCSVTTGVFVDFIQNADPGLTTTYEICETYVPFVMLDFMQGDPDPGGQWYDSGGNPISGIYDPATMNSGLYTYVIDTVAGCSPVFRTMNIDENVQPFAGNDTQISICENGVPFDMLLQLTGNPDAGGQWTSPQNTPVSGIFNPATYTEGIYRYLITANAPCIADQALLTITFLQDDPSGESASISLCANAPDVNMFTVLNGNPTAGGIWTNAAGQVVDGIFDPGVELQGTYNYVYPNVGCSPEGADLNIQVENLNNAGNDNTTTTCLSAAQINLNSLLTLGAELGGSWTNSAGQPVSNFFSPSVGIGNYSFNYNVSGGLCPPDASVISITVQDAPPSPPDLYLELCSEDAPIDLSTLYPTIPDVFFENQSNAVISDIYNPLSGSTVISAVVSSGNGCPNSEGLIDILVNYPLLTEDTIEVNICSTAGTYDLNTLIGAEAQNNGIWYDDNNIITDGLVELDEAGTTTYRFEINAPNGCGSNELIVYLSVADPFEAGPDENYTFCITDPPVSLVSLLPSSSSGVGIWSLNGLPFNSPNIDPATDVSGEYYYIVPQNGSCPSDFAIVSINIQEGINYSAGADISVCAGSPAIQLGQPGTTGMTYSWSPSTNLSSTTAPNPQLIVPQSISESNTTLYTVTIEDGVCTGSDVISVTIHPQPAFDLIAPEEICWQDIVSFSPGVTGSYNWTPAFLFENPAATSQTIELQSSATITCTVETEFGCSWTASAGIIVNPLPVIQFYPEPMASCSPLDVLYALDSSSTGIDQVVWEIEGFEPVNADTLSASITQTGTYDLTVTALTTEGCMSSLNFEELLEVYPSPVAQFTSTPAELSTIDPIAQFNNQSVDAIINQWNFGGLGTSEETDPVFEFPSEEPANFEVCLRVTNDLGCIDSTCRILHLDNQYILFVPNAFTPDNDGLNDIFLPVLKGFDETTYTLQIFDRWGEMIFTTNDVNTPWIGDVLNGTHYAKDDVYHWQILVKDREKAEYRRFRGLVTLIR
jgi:gliding motility-associated-like protein